MIGVAESSGDSQKNFSSDTELYRALRDYIGKVVSIRGTNMEYTGVLEQVCFGRQHYRAYFKLGQSDLMEISRHHHVEVLLDGNWKVLNLGSSNSAMEL